ncbi:Uncharacterised protein [Leclercia adecarboxylata]|uniref:Uncharacterized protein n=1 Tax=Leclercia adecarboxylata TaxID=83655 RepID=A0A4U9HUI1_9ENTR|nr:Uncharacterised protein [Leclercia adecarboxylata]
MRWTPLRQNLHQRSCLQHGPRGVAKGLDNAIPATAAARCALLSFTPIWWRRVISWVSSLYVNRKGNARRSPGRDNSPAYDHCAAPPGRRGSRAASDSPGCAQVTISALPICRAISVESPSAPPRITQSTLPLIKSTGRSATPRVDADVGITAHEVWQQRDQHVPRRRTTHINTQMTLRLLFDRAERGVDIFDVN